MAHAPRDLSTSAPRLDEAHHPGPNPGSSPAHIRSDAADAQATQPVIQVDEDYVGYTDIAGRLEQPAKPDQPVRFRRRITGKERIWLHIIVAVNAIVAIGFIAWLLYPGHVPLEQPYGRTSLVLGQIAFGLIAVIEITRILQSVTLWFFAAAAKDPLPVEPPTGLRVAVLTTIVPSSEPLDLVARTLRAMRRIEYDGQVDVWILDEGDDPEVKRVADELGVHHFSRKGRPEYNRRSGPYRAKTKAGNHNAWRAEHEHRYDVVAQMDPDHVPSHDFLRRTLGYFRDEDVAFVVAPQVYGNRDEGFVAHGAATQAYLFHGIIQRGGNGLDAPLLIGTNHLYRPEAWKQIGGYQDSIIEDHLTSLHVHGTENPKTGRRWKGVYTPDILAVGEGPTSWTDYFNQQKRWAYGVWEIVTKHTPRLLRPLSLRQRFAYLGLQYFYPSLALIWILGTLLTGTYLLFGIRAADFQIGWWAGLWGATVVAQIGLFQWLRRYNLAEHERRETAMDGIFLSLFTGPVYVAAAVAATFRQPLSYAVTAKGDLTSQDGLGTFGHHFAWAAAMLGALITSVALGNDFVALRAWGMFTVLAAAFPPVMCFVERLSADGLGLLPLPDYSRAEKR